MLRFAIDTLPPLLLVQASVDARKAAALRLIHLKIARLALLTGAGSRS